MLSVVWSWVIIKLNTLIYQIQHLFNNRIVQFTNTKSSLFRYLRKITEVKHYLTRVVFGWRSLCKLLILPCKHEHYEKLCLQDSNLFIQSPLHSKPNRKLMVCALYLQVHQEFFEMKYFVLSFWAYFCEFIKIYRMANPIAHILAFNDFSLGQVIQPDHQSSNLHEGKM